MFQSEYLFILPIIGLAFLLVFGTLFVFKWVTPKKPSVTKSQTYECGETTIGPTWIRFNVGYYLFGLLFLIFDIEAAFLIPWAVITREVGLLGLVEIGIFIFILTVGLAYAWKKGALEWV